MFRLFSLLYLALFGWKIKSNLNPNLKKAVFVVAPHTSNWDFIVGLGVRTKLRMKAKFLGKKELFGFPHGFFFRALGGYPVDRKGSKNLVDKVVDIFNEHESFMVAIAPEGTRKKVDALKSGFYFIAHKAKAVIILTRIDFPSKTVEFSEPFTPTGDYDKDLVFILKYYSNCFGKNPENDLRHLTI